MVLLRTSDAKESVMCIPQSTHGCIDNGYIEVKPKKHVERVSQYVFEHGDPTFVDERHLEDKKEVHEKSFLSSLFSKESDN